MNCHDDTQAKVSTAEVMTVVLVAAEFFVGNQQAALEMLVGCGYIKPLSKSRFNRRLHQIPESLWQFASHVLGQAHQQANTNNAFIVDIFPVPVCRNIPVQRRVDDRRKNMKEQLDACTAYARRTVRKRVETTFSQLPERMARFIHAVTPRGFELKIMLPDLASSVVGLA